MSVVPQQWFAHEHPLKDVAWFLQDNEDEVMEHYLDDLCRHLEVVHDKLSKAEQNDMRGISVQQEEKIRVLTEALERETKRNQEMENMLKKTTPAKKKKKEK